MKRLFAFALIFALSCTLWGCGRKTDEPTTITTVPTTTAPVTTTEPVTMPTVETNIPDPSVQTEVPNMTEGSTGGESQDTQNGQDATTGNAARRR